MLSSIIKKELLDNLLNLRFFVGLIVSVVLTVACVMIQAQAHNQRTQDYYDDMRLQDENTQKIGPVSFNFIESPIIKPEALSFVATALTAESYNSFDSNLVPQMFPFIDLVFVVSIILSLLGLLFSYDSICGEKQDGTLKLICSNSISKATILFGKLLGGTASLLIPFLISILCAAIYIALDPGVTWQPTDWAAFGALTGASMVFISLFYLLGMMVSALSHSSSVAILKVILLWTLIVLVIPNLGPYISTELYPIPSLVRLRKENNEMMKDMADGGKIKQEMDALYAELDRKYEQEYGNLFREYIAIPRQDRLEKTGMEAPDSDMKTMGLNYRQEYRTVGSKVQQTIWARMRKIAADLKIESERQTELAKNIAAVSPYADFIYLSADLAGTGISSRKDIQRVMQEFGVQADKYFSQKMVEKDSKNISDWRNMKNSPFDISDRPRFSYKEESLRNRLSASLPYLGALLLYGVLFFAIAFVGFIKYDVR